MSKIMDLKSAGVIQDVRELKSKKSKSSSNFDVGYAREKLKWDKEKISVRDNQNISKEQKAAAYETIDRKQNKAKEQSNIRQREKSIYEHSKFGKALNRIGEGARKLAGQRVISRQVLKKNNMQVHIQDKKIENVFDDPNRFFKGELNQEKRSLYFS